MLSKTALTKEFLLEDIHSHYISTKTTSKNSSF